MFSLGCGPSGMFFLHYLAKKKKDLEESGDIDALNKLPIVSCFEKAGSPGGVWRHEGDPNKSGTNMYEGLWINSVKESFEFHDYTFDEHFKTPQPAYITRKKCLEYILARVEKYGNIYKDVHFNTSVESVIYDDSLKQFVVTTNHQGTLSSAMFDKCIWAGGTNGKPKKIPQIEKALEGFHGKIFHSSEMNHFAPDVAEKRILMIGGNFSSEDLALQCTKLGSGKIYVTTRCDDAEISMNTSWPRNNVEVLECVVPYKVCNGSTILCQSVKYDYEKGEYIKQCGEEGDKEVHDIDIIIFCTGYDRCCDFLDISLVPGIENKKPASWKLPSDWRMEENLLTKALGHVTPSNELKGYFDEVYDGEDEIYFSCFLINNPNMMFIMEQWYEIPLLEIDVYAWLCVR